MSFGKEEPMGTRLFVGRLAHSKNEQDLSTMFAPCGTVESARIATDKATGESRGFGFVRMSTLAEAEQAISKFHSTELDGRRLIVRVAKSQAEKRGPMRQADGDPETSDS
jgi:RNA recognition motif-containing protein